MTITVNPHAAAILTAMGSLEALDQPIQVGDGVAPQSTDGRVVAPCAVLHMRPGGEMFSSMGCADTDATLPFQVTCVGKTAAQARIVADKVAEALDGATLTVSGREIFRVRRPRGPIGGAPERDDDVTPPLFYIPAYYSLMTAAA
jgi:hypothetical protein